MEEETKPTVVPCPKCKKEVALLPANVVFGKMAGQTDLLIDKPVDIIHCADCKLAVIISAEEPSRIMLLT